MENKIEIMQIKPSSYLTQKEPIEYDNYYSISTSAVYEKTYIYYLMMKQFFVSCCSEKEKTCSQMEYKKVINSLNVLKCICDDMDKIVSKSIKEKRNIIHLEKSKYNNTHIMQFMTLSIVIKFALILKT